MVIFHFKHSYLNWRAIPCKRRNDLCFCSFFVFSTPSFFPWFSFRLSRIFQVHDMTINFSFVVFFCFFLFSFFRPHGLSTSSNDACHRWLSKLKHLFSYEDRFERVSFWFKVYHFCLKRGLWLKSTFEKWVILVNMPQGIKDDFKVSRSWGLCFWSSMGFDRLETVASLDAYQITNFSFFQKLIIFVVWFSKNSRKNFWNRNFKANCLSRRHQKVYSIFSKSCPLGHQGFLFKRFQSGEECLSRWVHYQ